MQRPFFLANISHVVCVVCVLLSFFPFWEPPTQYNPQRSDDATLQAFRNVAAVNLIFESSLICNAQQKRNEKEMEQIMGRGIGEVWMDTIH